MIYVLEGPDGVGKTTLANEIAAQKKASVVHSYFDKSWDIKQHHIDMLKASKIISKWKPVVLDRWAPSEFVYGTVFRGKPGYDVMGFLWEIEDELKDIVWIYCRNDNAVENHLKNAKERHEMYDSMKEVVTLFDEYIDGDDRDWIVYDFDKVNMEQFVKELPNG